MNFSISNEFNLLPKTLLLTFPDRKLQVENKSLPFFLSQISIKADLIIWNSAFSYPDVCETSELYLTDVKNLYYHINATYLLYLFRKIYFCNLLETEQCGGNKAIISLKSHITADFKPIT